MRVLWAIRWSTHEHEGRAAWAPRVCAAREQVRKCLQPIATQRNTSHSFRFAARPHALWPAHTHTTLQQSTARSQRIRSHCHTRQARGRTCLQELPAVQERDEEADKADHEHNRQRSPAVRSAARTERIRPHGANASLSRRLSASVGSTVRRTVVSPLPLAPNASMGKTVQ